jgi:hypothetical protein
VGVDLLERALKLALPEQLIGALQLVSLRCRRDRGEEGGEGPDDANQAPDRDKHRAILSRNYQWVSKQISGKFYQERRAIQTALFSFPAGIVPPLRGLLILQGSPGAVTGTGRVEPC